MLKLYFNLGPNPMKIALFLEEAGIPFESCPVDTMKGEQHADAFRAVNPNGKLPAIDDDGTLVFDSNAILLYLAEKHSTLLGESTDRGELLSWLMFIATGLGPFSGQAVHFQHMAPEDVPYAKNRYLKEAERHYAVLDKHLEGREYIVGESYTIADISAWGWVDRSAPVLGAGRLAEFANLNRWFQSIDARKAVVTARQLGKGVSFKSEKDEEAARAMFPSNF